jgi:hypothetical protein
MMNLVELNIRAPKINVAADGDVLSSGEVMFLYAESSRIYPDAGSSLA